MKYYVVTPGGAGTWYLASLLGLHIKGGDPTFNPHGRDPCAIPPGSRVAYICPDPRNAILSFDRRGFLTDPAHCKHMGGNVSRFKPMSLLEYLESDDDVFDLQGHYHTWLWYYDRQYDIGFFKYESLPRVADVLFAWLGVPEKIKDFKFRQRKSDWRKLPSDTRHLMIKKLGYNPMTTDVEIINARNCCI